ncbi:hypothetical protein VB773_07085 [Haloarculaceae archaeon H-GB2-1]|nr:hypothetical protein [Haloarculaceae archaeon H-GB1-1]MEA5407355.1 hypothetical protein [Haloarculaceae archaeon H-GB2-1]
MVDFWILLIITLAFIIPMPLVSSGLHAYFCVKSGFLDAVAAFVGSLNGWNLAAGTVVAVYLVLFFTFLLLPKLRSFLNRNPWLRVQRGSLRLKMVRREISNNGIRWFLKNLYLARRESLWTYWSFLWVLVIGFGVVFALAILDLPFTDSLSKDLIQNGWQAQLTITSLSFIVLIFLLDQIYRSRYQEGVVQKFLATSRVMPVLYFSLFSSGLVAYLYFYKSPNAIHPFLIDVTFFVFLGTVVSIGYVYYRVAKLVFDDPLDEFTIDLVKRGLDFQLRDNNRQRISSEFLEVGLPDIATTGLDRDGRVFSARDLSLDGYIADIDLHEIRRACREEERRLGSPGEKALQVNLGLGNEVRPETDIVSVDVDRVDPVEVSDDFAERLSGAVRCSSDQPWRTGEKMIDENTDQIDDASREAISNLNSSGLRNFLGFYIELLEYATELNRQIVLTEADASAGLTDGGQQSFHWAASNYSGTPSPVRSLVRRVRRKFYRIFEAAAGTGNFDLITTVGSEIYGVCLSFHRQGEVNLFDDFIGLYGGFYRVLASSSEDNEQAVHDHLSSLQNLQTQLAASLGRAHSEEDVETAISDLESYYDVIEETFRHSIEQADAESFNKLWKLGEDAFIVVDSESEIFKLERQIEAAESKEEQDKYERELELRERQQQAVENLQDRFEEMRFISAASAYQALLSEDIPEEVFQEMFNESIRQEYTSFQKLSSAYFGMIQDVRLDLMRWEFDDIDIFGGARMSQPAVHTWLQEFFCAMGVLFLDPDEYEMDDLDEDRNPLADIDIDRTSYPDLEEAIESVSRSDLERLDISQKELERVEEKKEVFLALHRQMEEILERREEDDIIESDLDPEKVSSFKLSYIEGFEDRFTLRNVFDDLGWFESLDYDGEVEGFGFSAFYPKGEFIPDPPAEFVHDVDRRAQSHVDSIVERWLENAGENLKQISVESQDLLVQRVREACSDLAEQGNEPGAIVVSGFRTSNSLTGSEYFDGDISEYEEDIGGFDYGGSEPVPVYRDSSGDFDVLVLAGEDQAVEVKEYQRKDVPVFVDIKKVTREMLDEEDPEEFEEMSEEEIRDRLQSVWLQIWYYSEIDASDDFGAILRIE